MRYLDDLPDTARLLHRSVYTMRWRDMDAFGHLNNALYFTYFEQVRVDWLRAIEARHDIVLANVSCSFLQPLYFPAELEVTLYADNPGRSSLDSYYRIHRRDESPVLCAQGHGTIVWYDHESGHSVPIPPDVRRRLEA